MALSALLLLTLKFSPPYQFGADVAGPGAPLATLNQTRWQPLPTLESQWRRLVVPADAGTQAEARLWLPWHEAGTLWVIQGGQVLHTLSLDAQHGSLASLRLPVQPQPGAPVTLLYQGSPQGRIALESPGFWPAPHTLMAAGGALMLCNLMLLGGARRRFVLGRALLGGMLVFSPLLGSGPLFLMLALTTLLYLPAGQRRWFLPLTGVALALLWLPLPLLALVPALLLPLQLALLMRRSPTLGTWPVQLQLGLLMLLTLERLPAPALAPEWVLLIALLWQLSLQLEQGMLLHRFKRRGQRRQSRRQQPLPSNVSRLQARVRDLEWENRLLKEKSLTDPLTGLRNRQFFNERYRMEVARSAREGRPVSLLVLDLDHFKGINDTYGHPVGDHVLQQVAKRAYYSLKRPADALCRYGGEEFVILLPETSENGAEHIADTLVRQFRDTPIQCGELTLSVTVSIGVATLVQQRQMMEMELLRRADAALYQAKDMGRNQFQSAHRVPTVRQLSFKEMDAASAEPEAQLQD
ncbi:GGDEF domain-containing protein [Ferrimonas balearica]|uniref:sensor domain-containing diguanylate cyclase n=1 Tax=Ferrimonas balearica TaxID=44012 RepID=UPI001C99B27B|nr:GGDEF domain-containing protein [Ferrimonas balearica]MBY5993508.1 GGDEF domain-containing protein [Ferrimonas balearica]